MLSFRYLIGRWGSNPRKQLVSLVRCPFQVILHRLFCLINQVFFTFHLINFIYKIPTYSNFRAHFVPNSLISMQRYDHHSSIGVFHLNMTTFLTGLIKSSFSQYRDHLQARHNRYMRAHGCTSISIGAMMGLWGTSIVGSSSKYNSRAS